MHDVPTATDLPLERCSDATWMHRSRCCIRSLSVAVMKPPDVCSTDRFQSVLIDSFVAKLLQVRPVKVALASAGTAAEEDNVQPVLLRKCCRSCDKSTLIRISKASGHQQHTCIDKIISWVKLQLVLSRRFFQEELLRRVKRNIEVGGQVPVRVRDLCTAAQTPALTGLSKRGRSWTLDCPNDRRRRPRKTSRFDQELLIAACSRSPSASTYPSAVSDTCRVLLRRRPWWVYPAGRLLLPPSP